MFVCSPNIFCRKRKPRNRNRREFESESKEHSLNQVPGIIQENTMGFDKKPRRHSTDAILSNHQRTGETWNSSGGLGILGQGYGSPGVPRRLMNSLGTLTHGTSMSFISPQHTNGYYGTNQSYNTGNIGSSFFNSSGSNGGHLASLKLPPGGNIPKTPRPNKTNAAIAALMNGLKGVVKFTEDEMDSIKSNIQELNSHSNKSQQGKIYELEKYSKATTRYLKRIEFQLTLVEELSEQYGLQQKLREGVRTMAYAFTISEGRTKEHALANVKAGFRECTEQLCILESQLELLLGCFKMEMKGIQGFARLCPGDIFEITIKHGCQKWKIRGKIEKNGTQVWDLPSATFRATLGELMYIKAAEVKTLGKHILLGNKFCEITELFSPHSQLMTVNLNPSGSLKLNVVVTWNPLDSTLLEDNQYHTPVGRSCGSIRSNSLSIISRGSITSASKKRRLSPTEVVSSFQRRCSSSGGSSSDGSLNLQGNMKIVTSSSENTTPANTIPRVNIGLSQPPTNSRHSALWERSLDTIGGSALKDMEINLTPSKSARSTRSGSCSFRFSPMMPANKTARLSNTTTKSSTTTLTTTTTTTTSSSAATTEGEEDDVLPNQERKWSSSGSASDTDPSGNFTFMKKRLSNSSNHGLQSSSSDQLDMIDEVVGDCSYHAMKKYPDVERMDEIGFSTDEHEVDEDDLHGGHTRRRLSGLLSLRDSVIRLSSVLEDIQGQYPELELLELHVSNVEKMIQSPFYGSSNSSLNIESALECFDFLDAVTISEDSPSCGSTEHILSPDHHCTAINPIFNVAASSSRYHHRSSSNVILDPKMTARTTDSGISSMGHGSHSRTPSPPASRNSSPIQALVTGNHQLDMALEAHIYICLQLIHILGSFGPLKCREKEAVNKLQQQGIILGNILSRVKNDCGTNGLSELASLPQLQVLWEKITDTGSPLCTSADQAIHGLEEEIRPIIKFKLPSSDLSLSGKVSRLLVQQLLHTTGDLSEVKPGQIITVFQFQMFLRPHEHSFHKLVEDLADEEIIQNRLVNENNVASFIKNMPRNVPTRTVLITLVRSLLHEKLEVQTVVKEFFEEVSNVPGWRRQIIETGHEMLEFYSSIDRQSACVLLGLLNATQSIEELAYCAQTDNRLEVKIAAKQALLLLGADEGDRIHQQLTLSTHGFQGLAVN